AFLASIFVGAVITAAVERNKAIELQSEIDRRDNEDRIDAPYKAKLEESERRRRKLEEDLARKNKEAIELMASIDKSNAKIKFINAEYKKLLKGRPDINKIEGRYRDADAESICAEFTAMGIPCKRTGG
ncbi:hypothetical protein KAR91_59395, partial [Candidatus Pacearchaeota archaeon]|nr:hypothetical protein [Candidatus Pacearchaeota archaeon]